MFPFGRDYFDQRRRAAKAEKIEVCRDEFIRLLVESGMSAAEAERQLRICEGLSSAVLIGDKMVRIKKEAADGDAKCD